MRRLVDFCLALIFALSVSLAGVVQAQGTPDGRVIANYEALKTAIAQGVAGETLLLAPGTYGVVAMRKDGVPAVMRSADPDNPAVLHGLLLDSAYGLVLEDLVLRYRFVPEDPIYHRPFMFRNCKDVTLRNSRIEGDRAHSLGFPHDGKGYAIGLGIDSCRGVRLEGNVFDGSWRALEAMRSSDLILRGNEVTGQRMDGLCFVAVQNVRIEDNVIHTFDRVNVPGDHADMIQFWTAGTDTPTHDVTIRGNVLASGQGMMTQTIFMRNERVDMGEAGPEMFYRNIVIEDNVIINAHAHGITVGETDGLTIRRNTMAQNPGSAVVDPTSMVATPQIIVAPNGRNVTITGNVTHQMTGPQDQPDWRVENNLIVQNIGRAGGRKGFHYSLVFAGGAKPGLAPFRPRPGGPADDPDIGSRLLR